MKVVDLHCDVLEKLARFEDANFRNDSRIYSNFERLKAGNVKIQVFAIFIHPDIPKEQKFQEALRQIEAFHKYVLKEPEMVHIKDWKQIDELEEGQIGAVLSLEGCDAIDDDLEKLKIILDAGVKIVGLTWNYENKVGYGTSEDSTKGIKPFGKKVIELLNERDIIIDVAHLNERGFYELLPLAKKVIASHCNSRTLCDHPRNLTDEQVKMLVEKGGRIHVVFYPPFIEKEKKTTTIEKLVEHIKYLANLVGVEHIGFGSDFDGMDPLSVSNLSNASEFPNIIERLRQEFTDDEVKLFSEEGFMNYIRKLNATT
ncbi:MULTISPECIES: dipeptidase [Ureibacillus]|jgi:membrane dipeptidase|uniref:Membrane dipeptidase n=1 Tax=Ureibacillus thermosphaericus TaxID=51173 RepID=A0A840PTS5_URETH|nr:dipeptidase [Ureibacillus thermosphaericus]MBB5148152.1 membrane dipeptidase [Ureibacillus thermosphaericus]NKZ30862.1 membrane dipeptidase [Ureibacillus thermosphaericus]